LENRYILITLSFKYIYFLAEMHNFERHGHQLSDVLKSPYDYQSIMHYGKYSFALNSMYIYILFVII